jgi:hypothetical protein
MASHVSFSGKGLPVTDQPSLHVVAEISNDGRLVIGAWTYEVFTDPAEALAELADAHSAGLTEHRVYRLQPCRSLVSLPAVGAR